MTTAQQDPKILTVTGPTRALRALPPPEASPLLRFQRDVAICVGAIFVVVGTFTAVTNYGDFMDDHAYLAGLAIALGGVIIWIGAVAISAARKAIAPADEINRGLLELTVMIRHLRQEMADLREDVADLDKRFVNAEVAMKRRIADLSNKEEMVLDGIGGIATTMEDQLRPRRANRG